MSHAMTKQKYLEKAKRFLLETDVGMTPTQLADALGVDHTTAHRYLNELGESVLNTGDGIYRYRPTNDDIALAQLVLERALQSDDNNLST